LALKSNLRTTIKLLLPPLLLAAAKQLRRRITKQEWEYVPSGWQMAQTDPAVKGWSQLAVLETYMARWSDFLKSLEGTGPFGVSPEATVQNSRDLSYHNLMMTYGYALSLSSVGKATITMLDWGGGIGHYYLISKTLRPDLEIDYHCKDFPLFTMQGQQLFPEAHFHSDEAWKERTYDFVLVSSSLQYAEDWRSIFAQLASVTIGYIFVTRLPVVHRSESYVFVQRPYKYGYNTEYLAWCLNRLEILAYAQQIGLSLVREFIVENPPRIYRAPEQSEYWGFLFRKFAQ
jgi:putative methyltransferase (TIGR04325 family)